MKEVLKNGVCGKTVNTLKIHQSWRLLRRSDRCIVRCDGVVKTGIVKRIIHLSNGCVLFVVADELNREMGLYDACDVIPARAEMVEQGLTSYELLLRRFEPKGKSTSYSLVY